MKQSGTNKDALTSLAERCEAATSGEDETRELLWEAHYATQPEKHTLTVWADDEHEKWTPEYEAYVGAGWRFNDLIEANAFLDAAMTLVPEGALWKVDHGIAWSDEHPESGGRNYRAGVGIGDVPAKWSNAISATTSALALCAAALRAQASIKGDE